MFKKFILSSIILFLSIGFFTVTEAHVTLNPDKSEPGSYDKYDVRVPVEKDANTNKLELEVPNGVNVSVVEPVEGWKHSFDKDKDGNIKRITWTAQDKGIGPNEFIEFPIIVANPEDEGEFIWKAIQYYDNGDKVKWTDKDENSETPAPTTKVKKGMSSSGSSTMTTGTIVLWVISIIAILLSLIAIFKKTSSK